MYLFIYLLCCMLYVLKTFHMSRNVSSSKLSFHILFASSYPSSLQPDPMAIAASSVWLLTKFTHTQLSSDPFCPCYSPLISWSRASLLLHFQMISWKCEITWGGVGLSGDWSVGVCEVIGGSLVPGVEAILWTSPSFITQQRSTETR